MSNDDKNDAALTYLTDVANAFDPVEGPVEFEPNTWMRIRNAIFDLSAPSLMATSHKREISPGAIPAEGATPRTKREFYYRVVAELNLDTRDAFTKLLANTFALADQRDQLEAGLAVATDEITRLERELASKTRDADHFFRLSGQYLEQLAAHEAVRDACFDALGPECHVWGDVPGCIEELKRELASRTAEAQALAIELNGVRPYQKNGETAGECVARIWYDSQAVLGEFANERNKCERLENALASASARTVGWSQWVERAEKALANHSAGLSSTQSPSAWLYCASKPGQAHEWASVDPNDSTMWPKDQWTICYTVKPLYLSPPSATNDTDGKLGGIMLRYIDRLTDPVPDDPLEKIVKEMAIEVDALLTKARATATERKDT